MCRLKYFIEIVVNVKLLNAWSKKKNIIIIIIIKCVNEKHTLSIFELLSYDSFHVGDNEASWS